jgi:hypothetical protein
MHFPEKPGGLTSNALKPNGVWALQELDPRCPIRMRSLLWNRAIVIGWLAEVRFNPDKFIRPATHYGPFRHLTNTYRTCPPAGHFPIRAGVPMFTGTFHLWAFSGRSTVACGPFTEPTQADSCRIQRQTTQAAAPRVGRPANQPAGGAVSKATETFQLRCKEVAKWLRNPLV